MEDALKKDSWTGEELECISIFFACGSSVMGKTVLSRSAATFIDMIETDPYDAHIDEFLDEVHLTYGEIHMAVGRCLSEYRRQLLEFEQYKSELEECFGCH